MSNGDGKVNWEHIISLDGSSKATTIDKNHLSTDYI